MFLEFLNLKKLQFFKVEGLTPGSPPQLWGSSVGTSLYLWGTPVLFEGTIV
jgi:hypothetical protein